MDYKKYKFTAKEWIKYVGESIVITFLIAYLFYRSWYAIVLYVVVGPGFIRIKQNECIKLRRIQMELQFKEMLQLIAGALMAGYSIENAFLESQKDMERLYGEDAYMVIELQEINAKIALNQSVEKILMDFSDRSGIEEVESFCQVFLFAKRSGGDFVKIMQMTVRRIGEKMEVKREIETVISGKQLEQKVMEGVPIFLLLYINFTTKDFLNVLYDNLLGIGIMSLFLLLYFVSMIWAKHIVNIEV